MSLSQIGDYHHLKYDFFFRKLHACEFAGFKLLPERAPFNWPKTFFVIYSLEPDIRNFREDRKY